MYLRQVGLALTALLLGEGLLISVGRSAPPPVRLTDEEILQRERKAAHDPVQLLMLASAAEETTAGRLRQDVARLLMAHQQNATAAELDELATRVAEVLPAAARVPAAVRETLGPPQRIARQVLYRRYLEQWHYDTPLPLCVTFDCRKGQEPATQTVRPVPPRKL